ncbi:hypothetical protein K3300_004656, partial [Escherichia coli]|nr:hypothetical protein [Escherichia coli]
MWMKNNTIFSEWRNQQMKSSQIFYRSALATAVIMAFSGSAIAGSAAFSEGKLSGDVNINGANAVTIYQHGSTQNDSATESDGVACTEGSQTCQSYDMNGHNIVATHTGTGPAMAFKIGDNNGTDHDIVLKNSGSEGGKISAVANNGTATAVSVNTEKHVTLDNIALSAQTNGAGKSAVALSLSGTQSNNVTLNNVTLDASAGTSTGAAFSIAKYASNAADDTVTLNNSAINSGDILSSNSMSGGTKGTHTMTLNVNNSTIGQSSDKKINITTNGQDSNRTDTLNLNVKDSNVFADIYAKNYGTANVTLGSGSALVGDATAESETNGLNIALNDGATWDGDFTNKSKNSNKSTVSLAGNSHWTGDLKNSLTILDDKSNNSLSANAEVTLASGSRWDGDIVSDATNANTSVNINGSVWSGNVNTAKVGATDTSSLPDATATVSLSNGAVWLGGIATGATDTKTIATNVNLDDSLWVAGTVVNSGDVRTLTAGNLTAGNVSATNSTIDLTNGSTLNISSLTSKNSTLSVADKNKAQLNLSAATGDITLSRAGTLTNDVDTTHKYITLKKADNNNLSVLGTTESGAYQYDAKESKDESGNSFWTFARTDRASNASSVIQAMAA